MSTHIAMRRKIKAIQLTHENLPKVTKLSYHPLVDVILINSTDKEKPWIVITKKKSITAITAKLSDWIVYEDSLYKGDIYILDDFTFKYVFGASGTK